MVYFLTYEAVGQQRANIRNLDGDPHKIQIADITPDEGLFPMAGADPGASLGRRIRTEHVPTKIEWQGSQRVPDVDQPFGLLTVSDRFKDVVEGLEPSVHQFLPVEFVDTEGRHLAGRWFFIIGQRVDSVDRDHTTMILTTKWRWTSIKRALRRYPDEVPPGSDPNEPPKYVFNRSQIGAAHAWHDKFMNGGRWVSDELGQALADLGLSGISLTEVESV